MGAGPGGIGLCNIPSLASGIVLAMDRDQGRYAETTLVLLANLGSRRFGSHHDNGEVLTDLHAFLDDVEAVRVREARALLHQRHDFLDHRGVLLVGRQVAHEVGGGDQFLVAADLEAVLGGVLP